MEMREFTTLTDHPTAFDRAFLFFFFFLSRSVLKRGEEYEQLEGEGNMAKKRENMGGKKRSLCSL